MQHAVLAIITIAIVRVAWLNFKKLGALKQQSNEAGVDPQEHQAQQMRYVTWILVCLVLLAIAPFAFTIITK